MDKKSEKYFAIWQEILLGLTEEQKVTKSFTERVAFDEVKNNEFIVGATSQFTSNYFETNFKTLINKSLKDLSGEDLKVSFVQKSSEYVENLKKRDYGNNNNLENDDVEIEDNNPSSFDSNSSNVFNSIDSDITSNIVKQTTSDIVNRMSTPQNTFGKYKADKIDIIRKKSNLNERYTFDSFIYGDNTTFTYNVAYTIAKNPGITYNPCLIYGGVGLGKTHLLQSIGNYICSNSKRLRVIYVNAETFTNEFIAAIQNKQMASFQNKYRKVDVLLVDDIHFLQNKDSTQQELYSTFEDLYETKRQMVFTCDRPLNELKNMTERLLSRFGRGMNIDLKPPTYETKFAILSTKSKEQNINLDEDIINYLCLNINTNVRDLEAALMKLGAFASFTNSNISLEKAQDLIPPSNRDLERENTSFTVDEIIRATADYYELSHYDLKSKKRTRKFVVPRQIAIYISRDLTDFSTTEIGADFSRDHTTIMHAIDKIETALKTSEQLQKEVREIETKLRIKD
jgi:chromosomal replication initiator protein